MATESKKRVRRAVLETFKEYGGWWDCSRMAEWIDKPVEEVRKVYDELEIEGLMDRKS